MQNETSHSPEPFEHEDAELVVSEQEELDVSFAAEVLDDLAEINAALPKGEAQRLVSRIKEGDKEAEQALFRLYDPFIVRIIHKATPPQIEINAEMHEDLGQEARVALWQTVWKSNENLKFTQNAHRAILQSLHRYLYRNQGMHSLPASTHDLLDGTPEAKYSEQELESGDTSDIPEALVDPEWFSFVMSVLQPYSLETNASNPDSLKGQANSQNDVVDQAVSAIHQQEQKGILTKILDGLTLREREVLKMRFGMDDDYSMTLEEIGAHFHVTRERVRQIEQRALKKLRHYRFGGLAHQLRELESA